MTAAQINSETNSPITWGPKLNGIRVGMRVENLHYRADAPKQPVCVIYAENIGTNDIRNLVVPEPENAIFATILDAKGNQIKKTRRGKQFGSSELHAALFSGPHSTRHRNNIRPLFVGNPPLQMTMFNIWEHFEIPAWDKYTVSVCLRVYLVRQDGVMQPVSLPQVNISKEFDAKPD